MSSTSKDPTEGQLDDKAQGVETPNDFEEQGTKTLDMMNKQGSETPNYFEEQGTETPYVMNDQGAETLNIFEEEGTKTPGVKMKGTETLSNIDILGVETLDDITM